MTGLRVLALLCADLPGLFAARRGGDAVQGVRARNSFTADQLDPKNFAIAVPVTLAAALFGGWLMAAIRTVGFFGIFAGFIYGLLIGELALRLTGRKRGLVMEILAGGSVLFGLAGGIAIHLFTTVSAAAPAMFSSNAEPLTATTGCFSCSSETPGSTSPSAWPCSARSAGYAVLGNRADFPPPAALETQRHRDSERVMA